MAYYILLVMHTCLQMRALQCCFQRQWFQYTGDLSDTIVISLDTAMNLAWWGMKDLAAPTKPDLAGPWTFQPPPDVAMVVTDASRLGGEAIWDKWRSEASGLLKSRFCTSVCSN